MIDITSGPIKRVLLGILFLFALSVACDAQPQRDGYVWLQMSKAIKIEYVIGFTDAAAWAYGNADGQLTVLKSLSAKDKKVLAEGKKVWDYENIRYVQLVDGMDEFYAENLNKGIRWDRALSYVRDCIHGEPKEYLENELNLERRLATLDSTGK